LNIIENRVITCDKPEYKMKRKVLALTVISVLILSLFLAAVIPVAAALTTLYVDDSNVSGTEDGTSAHPYNTIQEALPSLRQANTIIVAAGSYTENIYVNKQLTIRSADGAASTTITAATTTVMRSKSVPTRNHQRLHGNRQHRFILRRDSYTDDHGHCTITNNICTGNNFNIYLNMGHYNNIICNSCTSSVSSSGISGAGIGIYYSHNNYVYGNTLSSNDQDGIVFVGSDPNPASYNTICSNTISGGYYGIELGQYCEGNTISTII
jgi:parallel beta-helix repeat protein